MSDDIDVRLDKGLRILAKVPTIIARVDRIRNHKEPVPPKAGLGHAGRTFSTC